MTVSDERLLTADTYQMIFDLIATSFTKREPVTIGYLADQIQYFSGIAISPVRISSTACIHYMMTYGRHRAG
jgi:ABC-type long-subunit fatty acid transport system fused permease/ATPase subunit